ncbi:hypothetical protein I6N95_24815 [Vagococcus sp. BWB3-3]|uniref:Alternate signal-mediated exported protein, CPF_0494 family n=1 Tax=Vagococcus allomyrinae TaxID=2794353 RepID=A0A940PDW0_9ENTE|nr:hypothetical protein [Vagococcus allomyrinae]MBP1044236.1 hypothetical protein [Vagococcus allomyrinae]
MMRKKGVFPIKTTLSFLLGTYLLCLSLSLPETNAYLKDTQSAPIINKLGDLKVAITDTGNTATTNLPIGTTLPREVTVHNRGKEDMFVRVLVHPVVTDDKQVSKAVSVSDIVVDLDTQKWKEGKDGYYYYLKRLGTSSTTNQVPLFTEIKGSSTMVAQDTLQLILKVEAITVRDYAYREAWWEGNVPVNGQLKQVDEALSAIRE